MDEQPTVIREGSVVSFKEGYDYAKKNIRLMVEQKIEDIENKSTNANRHMNDLEYGAYEELRDLLDLIDEMKP